MEIFDFINPLSSKLDTITQFFTLLIIGVFFGFVLYMILRQMKFKKFFNRSAQEVVNDGKLDNLILDFEHGLIEINGSKKSLSSFNTKVEQEAILNQFFNDKILNSVSSTLVGLGILGTFSGLAIGVSGFQMESTEAIKESIGSLLGGMGTAFVTSIHGMLWSLIFILIYQFVKHRVLKTMDLFYASMDKQYLATEIEIENYQNQKQTDNLKSIIKQYFVNEEEGIELSPKFYYKELLDNSRNQSNLLSTFAGEIREQLEEVIDQILEKANENFKEVIELKLVPVLEELRKEKQENAGDAIQKIIEKLEKSLKEMIQDFNKSISEGTKSEMDGVVKSLVKLTSSLEDLPKSITELSDTIKTDINEISNTVTNLTHSMTQEQEQSINRRREVEEQANTELSSILASISENIGTLMSQQAVNSDKFKEIIQDMDLVTTKNKENIDAFEKMVSDSQSIFERIQYSSEAMEKASANLNHGSESIKENTLSLKNAVENFVTENAETIDKIQTLQAEVHSNTSSFLNQFKLMENGIQKVFDEFGNGLKSYTKEMNNSMSSSIGGFVGKTKDAIEGINSLTTELNNSIEILGDKFKKNK